MAVLVSARQVMLCLIVVFSSKQRLDNTPVHPPMLLVDHQQHTMHCAAQKIFSRISHTALRQQTRRLTSAGCAVASQKMGLLKLAARDPENWDDPQTIANAAAAAAAASKAPPVSSVRNVRFFDADVCARQVKIQEELFGDLPEALTGETVHAILYVRLFHICH